MPDLNTILITLVPSLPETEDIYAIPGTPLMALSKGVTTAFTHVSALAPVYFVVTVTSGGAILGNCVMGNCVKAIIPSNKIKIEITIDKTGLCVNFNVIILSF